MKYMFATLCSKPAATNAAIGGTTARIRSVVVRALYVSQTARQTSALQSAPSAIAWTKSSPSFASAIASACSPTAPPPNSCWRPAYTSAAVATAPTKFPAYTIAQPVSSRVVATRPLAQAITTRLFPVKSSAPATTTRISPSENASPPSSRWTPWGSSPPPAIAVVAKSAPSAMNAPARTASANRDAVAIVAFATPTSSALRAIVGGGSASKPAGTKAGSSAGAASRLIRGDPSWRG